MGLQEQTILSSCHWTSTLAAKEKDGKWAAESGHGKASLVWADRTGGRSSPFSAFHPHGSGAGCEARSKKGPHCGRDTPGKTHEHEVTMSSLVREKTP